MTRTSAPMQVKVEWHEEAEIIVVDYVDAHIGDLEALREWERQLFTQLDAIKREHGKAPLAVCVDNLYISPSVAKVYGEQLVQRVARDYATRVARYGVRVGTRSVIAVEALRRKDDANLFDSLAESIAFLTRDAA